MKISTIVCLILLFFMSTISFASDVELKENLRIYLFASSTCKQCQELKNEFLPKIISKFGGRVSLQYIPVDDENAFSLQLKYENYYKNDSDDAVKLFVGNRCFSGEQEIKLSIEKAIEQQLISGAVTISPQQILKLDDVNTDDLLIAERFDEFSPFVVMFAGLADGINPCAFVTIVFFISVLSMLKKPKKEIIIVGGVFSLSVFLAYLLLGLGAIKAIKVVSVNYGISRFISIITFVLAVGLALINFIDYLEYRRSNNPDSIKLKLPKSIRRLINRLIASKMKTKNLILSAFVLGFLVSLLESMCTGQVYLPAIIYILGQKKMAVKALFYLILYNIMFIVPLLCVFGAAYMGVGYSKISKFFSNNVALSKLLLAILFVLLAFVLLLNIMIY